MKKTLALLLTAVMLCGMLSVSAFAANVKYADTLPTVKDALSVLKACFTDGSDATYDLNKDGKLSLLDVITMLCYVMKADDMPASGAQLFDATGSSDFLGRRQYYNYCPSVLQLEDGTRYIYYCTNKDSGRVIDYVGCRKGTLQADGTYVWGEQTFALSPSSNLWDSQHVCDPSVIKGDFTYNGEKYEYLMAYLGCVTTNSQDNEVGIAVSKTPEGPYTRVGTEPLVAFNFNPDETRFQWGVGQPSLVSIDKAGQAWLFYTYGDPTVTKTVVRTCDFSDLNNIVLGEEVKVATGGLKNLNNQNDFINNGDFVYDAAKDRFYLASDCHPNPTDIPDFISSHFRVAYFGGTDFSKAKWTNVANIGAEDTGFARNHNVGLVRDAYGHLLASDYMTVYYTVSDTGTSSQWTHLGTYRIHEFNFLLWK